MPFGYLEFSRAKRRELCTYVRAPPLAAAAAAGRPEPEPGSGLGLGLGLGSLPGLVLFESGFKGMGRYPNQTRSAVRFRTDPPTVANQLDSQRVRTSWQTKGCEPVGRPKVANQLAGQRVQPLVGFRPEGPFLNAISVSYTHLTLPTKRIV